jgi:hypothetical protein
VSASIKKQRSRPLAMAIPMPTMRKIVPEEVFPEI